MNKGVLLVVLLIVIGLGFFFMNEKSTNDNNINTANIHVSESVENNDWSTLETGTYTIDTNQSIVNWAGKKPLIDGYINSGTIALSEGLVEVDEKMQAEGSFIIDMHSLKVGLTATKPNQETALEGHLKGDRWFDVETHPTADFVINNVTPQADVENTFAYEIEGDLTIKGITHSIVFPATIYQTVDGVLVAEAATEIDRTKWGVTAGSGSFFDNLADNAIDDMISLSFSLVATRE